MPMAFAMNEGHLILHFPYCRMLCYGQRCRKVSLQHIPVVTSECFQ